MAKKILILATQATLMYPYGADSFSIQKGKAIVPEAIEDTDALLKNVTANLGPGAVIEDYDPENPEHQVGAQAGAYGSDRTNHMVQGVMTTTVPKVITQESSTSDILDSALAQALVTGTVNELVAENPAVLQDAGFIQNEVPQAQSEPVAVAKPTVKVK